MFLKKMFLQPESAISFQWNQMINSSMNQTRQLKKKLIVALTHNHIDSP